MSKKGTGSGSNTSKMTRSAKGIQLQQIFQFFRWNSEFQKERKELLISYLTSNEETK